MSEEALVLPEVVRRAYVTFRTIRDDRDRPVVERDWAARWIERLREEWR